MENVKDLVRQAQGGDSAAFAALYEEYSPTIYRFLRRRMDDPDEMLMDMPATPKVQWIDGDAPLDGSWIEVSYEEVTDEDATDDDAVGMDHVDAPITTAEDEREIVRDEMVAPNVDEVETELSADLRADDNLGAADRLDADEADDAPTASIGSVDLIAYPFVRFSSLRTFEKALWSVPGIRDVRLCHFGTLTLQFRIKYAGRVPLARRLTTLRGFPGTVSADAPGRLVLQLATAAEAKSA